MAREPLEDFWSNNSNGQEVSGHHTQTSSGNNTSTTLAQQTSDDKDVNMEGVEQADHSPATNGYPADAQNGTEPVTHGTPTDSGALQAQPNGDVAQSPDGEDVSETASQQTAHRMTTRARAHAASTPSPPATPSSTVNNIHPLFTFPVSSLPDRDFGLPPAEAEETRLLLMAYVQKQEEIARIATDLSHGMMQGERMRQDVFKWSKAEAHVREMSDGEDWYDEEEWGLDGQLGKGRDEEEDEAVAAGKKSTRQRRKPDREDR